MRREHDAPAHQHKFETSLLLVTITDCHKLPTSPTKKAIYNHANKLTGFGQHTSRRPVQAHNVDTETTQHDRQPNHLKVCQSTLDSQVQNPRTKNAKKTLLECMVKLVGH